MEKSRRQVFESFFIKRSLQVRLIVKIVVTAIIATVVCSCSLLAVYYIRYNSVLLYQMDQFANLTKGNIIFIILPALLISALVNFLLAVALGLYASRKYAVPIYKLEQWAGLLRQGKISAQIQFREHQELKDLSDDCNALAGELREKFFSIKEQTKKLSETIKDSPEIKKIESVLSTLDMENEPIRVHTTMIDLSEFKK